MGLLYPPSMSGLGLFLPFAAAYFLSYLFRTMNIMVGPTLATELSLSAADLGLLGGSYFITFSLAQIPLGILLDRFGARRVEALLLLVAAVGALLFAFAEGMLGLTIARALIGLGVSASLMGAFKFFTQHFPQEKLPALTGWIMMCGSLGAFFSTLPLEWMLSLVHWRTIFMGLAFAVILSSAWIFWGTWEPLPVAGSAGGEQGLWHGFRQILKSAYFWSIVPIGLIQVGGFIAIQSLWSSAWLLHVNGLSRAETAHTLAWMNGAMLIAYALIGMVSNALSRRGIGTRQLLSSLLLVALIALALIASRLISAYTLLWVIYGASSSVGTLSYALLSAGFPRELSGRVTTAYNFLVFSGVFLFQWLMGVAVDAQTTRGIEAGLAYQHVFWGVIVIQGLSWGWFVVHKKAPEVIRRS